MLLRFLNWLIGLPKCPGCGLLRAEAIDIECECKFRWKLDAESSKRFIEIMENPPPPSQAMIEAAERHRQLVKEGDATRTTFLSR